MIQYIKNYFHFYALLLCILLTLICPINAQASESLNISDTICNATNNNIQPLATKTKWYTRYHNGKYQKRLWDIENHKWLTDWIDM